MTKVLVTGGAGFIGSNLVDKLIKENFDVTIIDNLSTGKKENINQKAHFFKQDICQYDKILPAFHNIKYVFHLAALPRIQRSVHDPIETHKSNTEGTLNVLLAAKKAGVKKVVYSSSSSVYGEQKSLPLKEIFTPNPISPYAAQKLMGEYYCKIFSNLYGIQTVSLRYFSVYGPKQDSKNEYATVIPTFLHLKNNHLPLVIYGNGQQKRDFTHVDDVVRATIDAAKNSRVGQGEVINICYGKAYSINDLSRLIGGKKKYLPQRDGEAKQIWGNNQLAKILLAWEPEINLEEGLKKFLAKD